MRQLFALLAALALLLPAIAGAQPWLTELYSEKTAITAAGATADQSSALITRPPTAKSLLTMVEVTAGAVLLLDLNIDYYSTAKTAYYEYLINVPTAEGMTGTGQWWCVWGVPTTLTNDLKTTIEDKGAILPNLFRLRMDHGNATAATYNVYYQWLF